MSKEEFTNGLFAKLETSVDEGIQRFSEVQRGFKKELGTIQERFKRELEANEKLSEQNELLKEQNATLLSRLGIARKKHTVDVP